MPSLVFNAACALANAAIAASRVALKLSFCLCSIETNGTGGVPNMAVEVKQLYRKGRIVSDLAKTKRTERPFSCPRCGAAMDEIVSIAPGWDEPGLVAYECPKCSYVTSELVQPNARH
jgi:hypothetical protein